MASQESPASEALAARRDFRREAERVDQGTEVIESQ
jgi:hypothetical protein